MVVVCNAALVIFVDNCLPSFSTMLLLLVASELVEDTDPSSGSEALLVGRLLNS